MTFFRLTVKETLSELSFSNALKFWCGFLYKFRSTIENQHGRLVGDPLSFEIPMDISLETSCWRTPYFHLRPQNSRWRLQYFHWRPPYFFGGHPILSSETQIFSWENPRFSSYLQRKFGVSNENMGSRIDSLQQKYGSPVKILGSPTRIWGSPMKGGLQ